MELFGFEITRRKSEEKEKKQLQLLAPQSNDDGSFEASTGFARGAFIDPEGHIKTETELVTRYRDMLQQYECDNAVQDICNEAIIIENDEMPVKIVLDELKDLPDEIKYKIIERFEHILNVLNFKNEGYEIFKRWYVDGRMYYHIVINKNNPRKGIIDLRYIDPRKIKKIKEPVKHRATTPTGQAMPGNYSNMMLTKEYREYFVYNPKGIIRVDQGIKVAKDSICYIHSGIFDKANKYVLSHLHKAIKPLNQLRMLEDSTVIYRLARAPERRIFYIDVGNLPKNKAEQHVHDMMTKHKNRLIYNATTGEIKDDRKFMTMLEDFWLPRRDGKGTEITTLPGGENLGQIDDVEYFRKRLFKSLNVPITRLEPDGTFSLGRGNEITRDELKFAKYIDRLRVRFAHLFSSLLEIDLALRGVMTRKEWQIIVNKISYEWARDNYYSELKEAEILENRFRILQEADQYKEVYFSKKWIQKTVLRMTNEEIDEMQKEIDDEIESGEGNAPIEPPLDSMNQPPVQRSMPAPAAPPQPKPPAPAPQPKNDVNTTPGSGNVAPKPRPQTAEYAPEEKALIKDIASALDDLGEDAGDLFKMVDNEE